MEKFYKKDFVQKYFLYCNTQTAQIKNSNGKITLWEKEVNLTE